MGMLNRSPARSEIAPELHERLDEGDTTTSPRATGGSAARCGRHETVGASSAARSRCAASEWSRPRRAAARRACERCPEGPGSLSSITLWRWCAVHDGGRLEATRRRVQFPRPSSLMDLASVSVRVAGSLRSTRVPRVPSSFLGVLPRQALLFGELSSLLQLVLQVVPLLAGYRSPRFPARAVRMSVDVIRTVV